MSETEVTTPVKKPKRKRTLLQRIVNVFLYIGLVTFALLIFLFGFSQTQTFRNWLRDYAVEFANEELNGKISIEKIEGTIFTSLLVHNTVVTTGKDTLLNAGLIELKTSPLKIFLKKIYVRKVEIKDTKVAFVRDSLGELNISKLFPPSAEDDTSKSSFPFRIEIADCKLTNVNFSIQNFDKIGSRENYPSLNMDDLRIDNVFLSLKAFADIKNNIYEVKFDHLELYTNIQSVNLKNLSGEFGINPKQIVVNKLAIKTTNSDLDLNVKIDGLNLFGSTISDDLNTALMDISLTGYNFNFDDLSAFVPTINMLKGSVGIKLNASGSFEKLYLNKIVLDYEKTHLETQAALENITEIDKFKISADFKNSYINQPDVAKLLPSIGIPAFEKLGIIKIDTLTYEGQPLNFKSRVLISANEGKLSSDFEMNFTKPVTEYSINLAVKDFNLLPISDIATKLNLKGNITGAGFSLQEMNNDIDLVLNGSTISGIAFDSLMLISQTKDGMMDYNLFAVSKKSKAVIDGSFDFKKEDFGYKANGMVNNLNVSDLSSAFKTNTDLNFAFRTEGENLDPDKMNMFLTLDFENSRINDVKIDRLRTITDIFTDNNNQRVINFISDIADITFKGQFSIADAAAAIYNESQLVADLIFEKMDEFIYPDKSSQNNFQFSKTDSKKIIAKNTASRIGSIEYLIDLKDFGIISPFLENKRLEIDGDVTGNIIFNNDRFYLKVLSDLNYVKFWGKNGVYFLSKMGLDLDFSNSNNAKSTNDLDIDLSIHTDRIFGGTDFYNVSLNYQMKNNLANIDFAAKLEDYASAQVSCSADLRTSIIDLTVEDLAIDYKGFDIKNTGDLNVSFSKERIDFNKFNLAHSNGTISASGFLAENDDQNLKLSVNNIRGKDLFSSIFNGNGISYLDINLNFNGLITGNYDYPTMVFDFSADNLTYKGKKFGDFISNFRYADKKLTADIRFYDAVSSSSVPALKLIGDIPINLSFTDTSKKLLVDEDLDLQITSNNLDLTPYGEVIPGVSKFKGRLNSSLQVSGTINEPYPVGYLTLDNASFLVKYNNLEYNAGVKINVTRDQLSLDSLLLANSASTKAGGTIIGGGTAELENFSITSSQFVLNGNLKVLGDESKFVSPNLFGDLVISTNGNFEFTFDKDRAMLKAPINVDIAKLTYSQGQEAYTSTSENFIYKFVEDTITKNTTRMDFERLVNLAKSNSSHDDERNIKPGKFDYNIDVRVEDEATLTFILSKEFDQNLVAVLRGNFQYESIGNKPIAQGELELLEGSTLEFIKTFSADGKIRFESELSNPYLDITATYKSYYYPETSSSNNQEDQTGGEEEVAVKMRIKGPLKELDKNLTQQSDKLTVYRGTKNIEDNIPDASKDASDAVMFMILNKFNDNVTQQERNIVSSYAASFAGSIVGGFLNRQLGDYVRSLEIRQTGTDTKFILAGRAGKFRYSIGGSTAVFQDLGLANVKIEYPITRNFFMRLERKEALSETRYVNEMVNEVGLKYRFEF